eukprot:1582798-Rhodomonas_salina.1
MLTADLAHVLQSSRTQHSSCSNTVSSCSSHPACYAMAGSELACGAAEYAMSCTDHRERCESWHMELRALQCPVLSW